MTSPHTTWTSMVEEFSKEPGWTEAVAKARKEYEEEAALYKRTLRKDERRLADGHIVYASTETPLTLKFMRTREKHGMAAAYEQITAHFTRRMVEVSTRKYKARRGRK